MNALVAIIATALFSLSQLLCGCSPEALPRSTDNIAMALDAHQMHGFEDSIPCDEDTDDCPAQIATVAQADSAPNSIQSLSKATIIPSKIPVRFGSPYADQRGEPIGQNWQSPDPAHTPVTLRVRLRS